MKKALLFIVGVAAVSLFGACKKSNSNPTTAGVMFVNGCIGTDNVSVSANSTSVSGAQNLAFLSNSGYQNVIAGSAVNISYILSASGLSLGSTSAALTVSDKYSIFLGGSVTNPKVLISQDVLTPPPSGDAEIRLVNLSPDTLSLSGVAAATAGSVNFGSSISSVSGSSFTPIAAGTYKIEVQDAAHPLSLEEITAQTLTAGSIYTLIYTGTATGTGSSAYTLTLITN